jgi:hypothetical protein
MQVHASVDAAAAALSSFFVDAAQILMGGERGEK